MKRAAASAAATTAAGAALYVGAVQIPGVEPTFVANVLLTAIGVLLWTFVLLYGFRSRWQATHVGRVLLYLGASFAATVTQVTISVWTHSDYPLRDAVRAILYFVLLAAVGNLVWTVIREQREDRRDP
ncbi:membrane protein [Gordonia phage Gudmit]|nr:membrane protein [Gordonia phage Gudmit]